MADPMPDPARHGVPTLSSAEALAVAHTHFGLRASARPLDSDRDQNFLLETGPATAPERYVLKIANADELRPTLDAQNAAMEHIARMDPGLPCPRVRAASNGDAIVALDGEGGQQHLVRLLTYLPGRLLAETRPFPAHLLSDLGAVLGRVDRALATFEHPGTTRRLPWDLAHAASVVGAGIGVIEAGPQGKERARIVRRALARFERDVAPHIGELRRSVIHNDANDHNVVVQEKRTRWPRVAGILDFGDLVRTCTVFEPAIAAAYAVLDSPTLLQPAVDLVLGYHAANPLSELEAELLYDLIAMRLCTSVAIGARQIRERPDNAYLAVTQTPAWACLERLDRLEPEAARQLFHRACHSEPARDYSELLAARQRQLGPSLSLSYAVPLHIVAGRGATLYDSQGNAYLDCVNNVCHVGHTHPAVVAAAHEQMARLNTNTRYLHETRLRYARRLGETLPDGLDVCFFVNSGSEANELALRLARAHTGRAGVVVLDGAYHGNTSALVRASPYKYRGQGGFEQPPDTVEVPTPDRYRGPHRDPATAAADYAEHVRRAFVSDEPAGAFMSEPILGCGGQIVPPVGYLAEAYRHARAAGAICIADEVQIGFGRLGSHFWGFEAQKAVPDVVVLGKPIGNGHPLGAVITTRAIADSFANGMEYFSTFGGNPVSCAVGLAVLDVIEEEGLQAHAATVGAHLLGRLRALMGVHSAIGDVRGLGLFVGVELESAPLARAVVERLRSQDRILTSVDGPRHTVIKLKPPLVFSRADADRLVSALDSALDAAPDATRAGTGSSEDLDDRRDTA